MKRAIIIHAWEETPEGQWLPWVGDQLRKEGWSVEIPEMPDTKTPTLDAWMAKLESLTPNKDTVLIGHSLSNALILRFLEKPDITIKGAVMVAAWDWLMETVKEFHQTFFGTGFDYDSIKKKHLPLTIINSTNDPWIDFARSKKLAQKIEAEFITVENAGHFMARDGYSQFPLLVETITKEFI